MRKRRIDRLPPAHRARQPIRKPGPEGAARIRTVFHVSLRMAGAFAVLTSTLVSVMGTGCRGNHEPKRNRPAAGVPKNEAPSQEGWNSDLILSRAGKRQAVVHYGHMAKYEGKQTVFFDEGVRVDFFGETGDHTSTVHSQRGEYNEITEQVKGIGQVVAVSDTGITLRTPVLEWDPRVGKIVSDSAVMVTTQMLDTLYGFGFESSSDLGFWTIRKVSGVTAKHVALEKFESELTRSPAPADTLAARNDDSTAVR
jgi:LPS export ABC transporter protein LptC